jgi:hypothetical protein
MFDFHNPFTVMVEKFCCAGKHRELSAVEIFNSASYCACEIPFILFHHQNR